MFTSRSHAKTGSREIRGPSFNHRVCCPLEKPNARHNLCDRSSVEDDETERNASMLLFRGNPLQVLQGSKALLQIFCHVCAFAAFASLFVDSMNNRLPTVPLTSVPPLS